MKQHDFILLNRLDDFMNTFLTDLLRALLFEKCGTEVKYHNAHFLSTATIQVMPRTNSNLKTYGYQVLGWVSTVSESVK